MIPMLSAPSDVVIRSNRIILPRVSAASESNLQISTVSVLFRLDGIALEPDETFTLEFTFVPGRFGNDPILTNSSTGTVIDATGNTNVVYSMLSLDVFIYVVVNFQLSEADYRVIEGPGTVMPVTISKDFGPVIATDVTFMVIPMTVDQALVQNTIDGFPNLDPFSPNRAGYY